MNNEIKEINLSEMLFNRDERLLNYITNLQQRIKKAIEYIKENESVDLYDDVGSEFIRNLLNILNGRSDTNVKD